jgi:transcriptional regulator with XRE-family HTH domain
MTQRALAQASGITLSYVVKIEDGSLHGMPSGDVLRSIARTLGSDEMELFDAAGRKPSPFEKGAPIDNHAFINAIRRLDAPLRSLDSD